MKLDFSIGRHYRHNDGIFSHLQEIAKQFSAIGDHWAPLLLIDDKFVHLPDNGKYTNIPLFIEVNKYGSQLGYNVNEGFVTHTESFNAQRALIPVGWVTVNCKLFYYIDDDGWEQPSYDISMYDWKYRVDAVADTPKATVCENCGMTFQNEETLFVHECQEFDESYCGSCGGSGMDQITGGHCLACNGQG